MQFYKVIANFDTIVLKFKIASPDKITPAIERKLKAMGFPNLWGSPSKTKIDKTASDLVVVTETEDLDLSSKVPVSNPTSGTYECSYNAEYRSVAIKLSGSFLVHITDDIKPVKNASYLYISGITLQDAKGKDIKFPKDEYGMSSRIEATITGTYTGATLYYQIPVKFVCEKEDV